MACASAFVEFRSVKMDKKDVIDICTLANEQLNWLSTLISTAKNTESESSARRLLEIAEYLADDFSYHYDRQIEGLKDD